MGLLKLGWAGLGASEVAVEVEVEDGETRVGTKCTKRVDDRVMR